MIEKYKYNDNQENINNGLKFSFIRRAIFRNWKSKYPTKMKHYLYIIIFFTALSLIACESSDNENSQGQKSQRETKVDYFIPQWSSIVKQANSTATFVANESVSITSEVAGKIDRITFKEGEYVNQGELLAVINTDIQRAEEKKLKLQLELAEKEWNRAQNLLDIDAITQEEADRLQSELKTLQADLERIRVEIDKRTIEAPFSGILGERYISPGAFITPGTHITMLFQTDPLKLDFRIPEGFQKLLNKGDKVSFSTPSYKDTFQAEIYLKSPMIDEDTRSVKMRAKTQNSDNKFSPGGYAEVFYGLKAADSSTLVPAEALIPELDGQKLLTIKDNKVKSQKVEIGIRTENAVEITEGINESDTIIMTGLLTLKENNKVVPDIEIKLDNQ